MDEFFKIIKDNNLLDFKDNDISITNVIVNKKTRLFELFFTVKNTLNYSNSEQLIGSITKFFQDKKMDSVINIRYDNFTITSKELKEYYNQIMSKLISKNKSIGLFKTFDTRIENENLIILVDSASDYNSYINMIKDEFNNYFLHGVNVILEQSSEVMSANELQKQIEENEYNERFKEKEKRTEIIEKSSIEIKGYKKPKYTLSNISDIPNSREGLVEYTNNENEPVFKVQGEIFFIELRTMKTSNLLTIKIYDETDSIVIKKWVRSTKEIDEINKLKSGDIISIEGRAEFDTYSQNVVLMASSISYSGIKEPKKIEDNAPVKRVELHTHTMMSTLDGISTYKDYIELARSLGHKALAITDHNGVYSFAKIHGYTKKMDDFKPIYGVELNYLDDEVDFDIALTNHDINLKDATYVVFDVETTGFSQTYDQIIEIAAVKVRNGEKIDRYSSYVKPTISISEKITRITGITNEMVSDAPSIDKVMKEFIDFCEDSILVAHNARFDVGMMYATLKKLGIQPKNYPVIDTLNLMRAFYNDQISKFGLKPMAKFFKVKQTHHHSAVDDTEVTTECFLYILQDLNKLEITNYNEINNRIPDNMFKYVIPSHINILAKTQTGYKNMFKILSDALTVHCHNEGRLLKKVLKEFKEGILIGSGCVNNKVFQYAMNRSQEELEREIDFYDYIEVQPPLAYKHLFNDITGGMDTVLEVIQKIIKTAKKLNKIVVATSDAHYLTLDMKDYRNFLIAAKLGGNLHPLAYYDDVPHVHFRTTNQMLEEFSFLDKELAYEIVVTNTNFIADSIDKIEAFPSKMFAPNDDEFKNSLNIPSIAKEVRRIVAKTLKKFYGDNPHEIVTKRAERELNSIIDNGFASVYYMSHLLVEKSLSDGYLVGSRGSVGSSLVATMMNITEINPLSPHYRCKECCFTVFKMNEEEKHQYLDSLTNEQKSFVSTLDKVESGYDLPDAICPICSTKLTKDGHDIPFETFLGFDGDKVPDIDLNFSGEYQSHAHEYVRELLGHDKAFRGGTVGTIAEKNAFGYVKAYDEQKNLGLRTAEIERIASKLVGVKRSTGQHPGGIIVLPYDKEIYDVTPIQYPADNAESSWRTTHFDYHAFEDNLLKLDILGHDDPTMIRFMMDYVKENQDDFPFTEATDIPVDDKAVYALFSSTSSIGVTEKQISSKVASYAVPEFGTPFVRQMLQDTLPKTFAELVKISGLSHGTDVWLNNAESLVNGKLPHFGNVEFSEVIGCRDDIMVYLMYQGVEPIKAFEIMEFVRRGKPTKDKDKWNEYKEYLNTKGIKEWYIWSCEQIKYMFPKAHATAYVLMAIRIAWFKVHAPIIFYSAYFSKRAKAHNPKIFVLGEDAIRSEIESINKKKEINKKDVTAKDEDMLVSLYVALEMTSRGLSFLPIDIEKSEATIYKVEDGKLRIPFTASDGLGESVAYNIVEKRNEKPFTSIEDVTKRTRLNKSLKETFENMNAFGDLPEDDEVENLGIFALDLE